MSGRAPVLLAALLLLGGSRAQAPAAEDRLAWWREARFGMFIHWGLYALPGGEWKDSRGHAEWIRDSAEIPLAEYEELAERWNPVAFDADEWVAVAKAAGMRYVVITSKHHDGFGLWDSALGDWDVGRTPHGEDILRQIVDACRRGGLRVGFYHSIMDWHHPDYLPRRTWESERSAEGADFERFVRYLHGQVSELLTRYGPLDVLWFDGEWEPSWTHERGRALFELCRRLQPDLLVNNRVDKGRGGMAGLTADGFLGDFGTPEQEVPATGLPGVDWETCMTLNDHWGFSRQDENWKSAQQLLHTLLDVASKGGNFLLNVGPTPEGRIPAPCALRLAEVGRWLAANGEALYGTSAGPFEALPWGRCTSAQDGATTRLYLHVFERPADGVLVVPGLANDVRRAAPLARPETLLALERHGADVHVTLAPAPLDPLATVVVLEIEGAPAVHAAPRIEARASILVQPLEVRLSARGPARELRYTLDGKEPSPDSPRYEGPFRLAEGAIVTARAFQDGRPVSPVARREFRRVRPRPAADVAERLTPGLRRERYDGTWSALPDFDALAAVETAVVAALDAGGGREHSGLRFSGLLAIPEDDVYELSLTCDDGGRVWLGEQLLVDNDGLHAPVEQRGVAALAAGLHPLRVEWFNRTGGALLELRLGSAGGELLPLAADRLRHAE